MKKLFILIAVIGCFKLEIRAQSTEIMPGTILPQMTTAQRTAVTNPNGVLVFDSDTQSYWFRQSGSWVELPKGGSTSNYWQLNGLGGNEIQNTNSGGFWSANPTGLTFTSSDVTNPPTAPISGVGTRLIWIPSRSAFRAGTVSNSGGGTGTEWDAANVGLFSTALGFNTTASGDASTAMGYANKATGDQSTVMGLYSTASGTVSSAIGYLTVASGKYSTALNYGTHATGDYSTAIGAFANATGSFSIALGLNTTASGYVSTALGNGTTASDSSSTAMGYKSKASGNYSTAMGYETEATKYYSTSFGYKSISSGLSSTAMGYNTVASGTVSTALGISTIASGAYSSAMGYDTEASGFISTALGHQTTASGNYSTALGRQVSTGGKTGAFIIGDSNPGGGAILVGATVDQFIGRFNNGFYLVTSASGTPTKGVRINHDQTAWSSISDSTKKENFVKANGEDFLAKLKNLKLGSWNYKSNEQNPERFYGPMAQEIFTAYGKDKLGTIGCDTLVSTLNMDGLLFIFAQALEKRTAGLNAKISALEESNAQLMADNNELKTDSENRFAKLENLLLTKQKIALKE